VKLPDKPTYRGSSKHKSRPAKGQKGTLCHATFGNPDRFEIAVGWTKDREARDLQPAHGGWSTGALRITVGGHVLTLHHHGGKDQHFVHWYLLPVFEWLAENWIPLFHEEKYS